MILRLIAISLVLTALCLGETHSPATDSDAEESVRRRRPLVQEGDTSLNPTGVELDSVADIEALGGLDADLDKLHSLIGKPNQQANRVGEQSAGEGGNP